MRLSLRQRKRNKLFFVVFGAVALASLLMASCDDSPKAPPAAAKPIQQTPKSVPTATHEVAVKVSQEVYRYVAGERKDPFAPIIVKTETKARGLDRPPLERHNISEFKLSGIVWGGFGYNAMVEGPDGKGYFVRVGTIIGPNGGVVKKISQNALVIEEKFRTLTGETQRKEIVVELRKKREGNP